jgi:uncharacterized protein YeaO (DUF488 family)/uncharacterized protein YdhG (YjbR/CyaY superfamily)
VPIRIVRLGSPRAKGEGLRLGTVRRPPRGVPKAEFASRDFYDIWLPEVAPSEPLVKAARQTVDGPAGWRSFVRRYRTEMKRPEASHILDLLAALSRTADLSVGCYCPDEMRCHRSVLRALLAERGAQIAGEQGQGEGRRRETAEPPETIDEYLAGLSDEKRAALEKVRKAIRAAAPKAEECIRYGVPTFRLGGKLLISFGAGANHCALYGATRAHLADLSGYDTSKGTIRFAPTAGLPPRLVRKLVKSRMAAILR